MIENALESWVEDARESYTQIWKGLVAMDWPEALVLIFACGIPTCIWIYCMYKD